MGGGRAEVARVVVTNLAAPVTVTPQLGPGSPGGGAFVAEVVGYGVRGRTAWGRLGATNSCVPRTGSAFGDASYAEVRRLEGLSTCSRLEIEFEPRCIGAPRRFDPERTQIE